MLSQSLQSAEQLFERLNKGLFSRDAETGPLVEVIASALVDLGTLDNSCSPLNTFKQIDVLSRSPLGKRSAALFLVRCLAVPGAIKDNDIASGGGQHAFRKIAALVEQTAPDIAEFAGFKEKKQTVDKIEALRDLHRQCLELLSPLTNLPTQPQEFAGRKQDVLRLLNNKFVKAYLNNYEFAEASNAVRTLINGISDLLGTNDLTFGSKLYQLAELAQAEINLARARSDFFAQSAYLPFLLSTKFALEEIEKQSSDRFACNLRPRRSPPNVVERRYRLHEANQITRVNVTLINDGPGIAADVMAQIVNVDDRIAVSEEPIDIGAVPPGEFALSFEILVGDPCSEVKLLIDLSWQTPRTSDRQTASFDVVLQAQNPNIDWNELESTDPYSTTVAQGDEFVGRRQKVMALVNRLRKQRMQSSYITGQKRVGKNIPSACGTGSPTPRAEPGVSNGDCLLRIWRLCPQGRRRHG